MPFIGQEPITGAYHVLDAITTSATATYNLQLNSGAFSPATANQLLVSLNGVIQKPGSSFTISGSQITFSSALTSSDSIDFIIALGDVLNVGTPTDGSVATAKIAPSAVTDAKIADMAASKLTGAFDSSHAFHSSQVFPAGHVIQTVVSTSTTTVSTTSGSPQDLLSVSITPKFTNSLITLEGYISRFDIAYNGNAYGSVYLINPAGSGITTAVAGDAGHNNANIISVFGSHSPNSTSSQTYKLAFSTASGSTSSVNTDGQRYSLILKEIAQ